jgi:hypothetical protein
MLGRRAFVFGLAALALVPARRARGAAPEAARALLPASPFVYVCPLRSDGSESRCHGEVWYAWLDERVVLITARDRWKATAVARGLDRARIWVGDHGRWKGPLGATRDDFRRAPSFDARAARIEDPAVFERLLAAYEAKYPKEIGAWRDRFRAGLASGERVLIGYTPL